MSQQETAGNPWHMWDLSHLGYCLHDLRACTANDLLIAEDEGPTGVADKLESLINDLTRFELQESDDLARQKLAPLAFRFRMLGVPGETTLGSSTERLHQALDDLLDTIRAEAGQRQVYPVAPSKHLQVDRLIREPSQLFGLPDRIKPRIPDDVDANLREAGRCLAAGFGPAAVLLTLLATESITKYYYRAVVQGPLPKRATWGHLVNLLDEPRYECPEALIKYLRGIVQVYRNPAIHEGLELDSGLALSVWEICSEAAKEMLLDLHDRELISWG